MEKHQMLVLELRERGRNWTQSGMMLIVEKAFTPGGFMAAIGTEVVENWGGIKPVCGSCTDGFRWSALEAELEGIEGAGLGDTH
jgi:hypothetical protein